MKKVLLILTLLINTILLSQHKDDDIINLDSISIHYTKDAFKSYRDSLDTYLSRLSRKATREVYFKLEDIEPSKDTLKLNGIMHLNIRLKIKGIEYTTQNKLDNIEKDNIESDFKGEVVEILVKDGDMVEYGTTLFKIKEGA